MTATVAAGSPCKRCPVSLSAQALQYHWVTFAKAEFKKQAYVDFHMLQTHVHLHALQTLQTDRADIVRK